jgi:tRNA (guanine-N7-)-methyltransferase
MPNIQTSKLNYLPMPQKHGEYIFKSIAKSRQGNEDFILTEYKGQEFLLRVIYRKKNILIKGDKLTKVSPISIVKNALKSFHTLHNLELSFSNIGGREYDEHFKNSDKYLKDMAYFMNDFQTDKEIWVEVGFGSGRHLLHQAKENPNIQFIAIEIHRPSIEQVIAQCKIQNLENILIINFDARIFLELLESNSVGKIFVHFPIPWDKKPHRRVISHPFIEESIRVLKPNGQLELRTDSENYYAYSYDTFISLNQCDLHIRKNQEIAISSKYEDRWKKMEKNIYDITLINHQKSEPKEILQNLYFTQNIDFENLKKRFHNHTIKGDDFFVHFEDLYEIDSKSGLLKLSFGSFEKSEHKYVIITNNEAKYFPDETLPIKQNIKSHKKIEEFLYV